MRLKLAALSASILTACGSVPQAIPEPVVRTIEVRVPVPTSCIKQMPQRPAFQSEAAILALPDYDAGFLLWSEWELKGGYIDRLEAVLAACVADGPGIAPSPAP